MKPTFNTNTNPTITIFRKPLFRFNSVNMFLAIFLFMILPDIQSQDHQWAQWIRPANDNASDSRTIVEVDFDDQGNVYVLGSFKSPVIIGTDTLQMQYPGSDDIYLAKFSGEGQKMWAVAVGGTFYDFPKALLVNDSAVFISATIQFNVVNIADTMINNQNQKPIICFDQQGNFKSIYYEENRELHAKLVAEGEAFYYVTEKSVVRMDEFGNPGRRISLITSNFYTIADMHVYPDQQKLIGGYFTGNLTYQDTTVFYANLPGGASGGFIMKLDENDSLVWMKSFGTFPGGPSTPLRFTVAENGNIYLSLTYSGNMDFFGDEILVARGGSRGMLASLDKSGELLWHKTMAPYLSFGNYTKDIYTNDSSVYIAGTYSGSLIYDEKDTLSYKNAITNIIYKTDLQGNLLWIDIVGGTGGNSDIFALTGDDSGNLYAGGISYSVTNPRFGCDVYPDIVGSLVYKLRDREPGYLPQVDFTIRQEENQYFFFSEIANADSWSWNFDDGTELLTGAVDPSHRFEGKGTYEVTLEAQNECGRSTAVKNIKINGLRDLLPNVSGSTNLYAGEIRGAGFTEFTTFKLMMEGADDYVIEDPVLISSSQVNFSLDLDNASIGDWDLVMTNGTESDTLEGALRIEPNIEHQVQVDVSGPSIVGRLRWNHLDIRITNNSNINYQAFPIAIVAEDDVDLRILNTFADDSVMQLALDTLGNRFLTYTPENGEAMKIGFFAIPLLRAHTEFQVKLLVNASGTGIKNIRILTGKSFVDMDFSNGTGNVKKGILEGPEPTCLGSKCADCLMSMTTYIPVVGCATGIVSLGCTVAYSAVDGNFTGGEMFDIGLGVVGTVLSCGGAGAAANAAKASARASVQYLGLAAELADIGLGTQGVDAACGGGNCSLTDLVNFFFDSRTSIDPNEKYGMLGVDENNYVHADDRLHYTFTFENLDSATAAAGEVNIYDTLDVEVFDMDSFNWTGFGYGDTLFIIPPGKKNYTRDIDLRPKGNIILRFNASLDSTGVVHAQFTSLDTSTYSLTPNILDYFLPPNVNPPEGEGFISFALYPAEDIPNGTQIRNKAEIIFDLNEVIQTGTWVNTIDIEPPVTSVTPLDDILNDTVIHLQWQGSDPQSGIQGYDVYVSENDSAFKRIVRNLQSNEIMLYGKYGAQYGFYVTATDYAGNQEIKTALAETVTSLELENVTARDEMEASNTPIISLYPVPVNDLLTLEIKNITGGKSEITIFDATGRFMQREKTNTGTHRFNLELDVSAYSNGVYYIQVVNEGGGRTMIPFTKYAP